MMDNDFQVSYFPVAWLHQELHWDRSLTKAEELFRLGGGSPYLWGNA